jgi:phosphonate utilization transcriptional regulator
VAQRPVEIEVLQNQSLPMLVQRELERMVLTGELAVGVKLDELGLAGRLGVSRGPVREAVRALAETGLVRLQKNRGVFVREISVTEADEIFEVRAAFDQMAGRKLASAAAPGQLAELRAIVERMRDAAARQDLESYHAANLRFHDALVEFAGNAKLLQMYRRLVNELSLYRRHTLTAPERLAKSTLEHRRILQLITSGDADAAGQELYEHAMASRARVHSLTACEAGATGRWAINQSADKASGTPPERGQRRRNVMSAR